MFEFNPELPVAGVDRIASPQAALAVVFAAMSDDDRFETVVLALDRRRRGRSVLVVTDTEDPDALLGVVDMIAEVALGDADAGGIVVASVRPGGAVEPGDAGRWVEADEICDAAGIDLVEWFVLGASIGCPRELRDEPARWA